MTFTSTRPRNRKKIHTIFQLLSFFFAKLLKICVLLHYSHSTTFSESRSAHYYAARWRLSCSPSSEKERQVQGCCWGKRWTHKAKITIFGHWKITGFCSLWCQSLTISNGNQFGTSPKFGIGTQFAFVTPNLVFDSSIGYWYPNLVLVPQFAFVTPNLVFDSPIGYCYPRLGIGTPIWYSNLVPQLSIAVWYPNMVKN